MTPPFFGTKIVEDATLDDLLPLIDREALFAGRWQLKAGADQTTWKNLKSTRAAATLERMVSICRANRIIEPKIVYGYFECRRDASALIVEDGQNPQRFNLPRERKSPNRSLADFFPDGFAAMFVATAGARVTSEGAKLFAKKLYSDLFYLKGFAAELAEALAKFCQNKIRNELGIANDAGERFGPGFPSFPNIFDQKKLFALLKPERIGVSLTETCHMIPEYSVSAIVSVDPDARHFMP